MIKTTIEYTLKPILLPSCIAEDQKDGRTGVSISTTFELEELDAETLEELCEDFTTRVFERAKKPRPAKTEPAPLTVVEAMIEVPDLKEAIGGLRDALHRIAIESTARHEQVDAAKKALRGWEAAVKQ